MKWYEHLIYILLIIIVSPLILFGLMMFLIVSPFIQLSNRKKYKNSAYYKDFRIPYSSKVFHSKQFVFYNYSIEENLPIKYVKQKNNSLDYFIYNDQIFIFPDFNELIFNEENNNWDVVYGKYEREAQCSLEEYMDKKIHLFEEQIKLPVKLLLARNYIDKNKININELPESLYIVRNYCSPLDGKDRELLNIIPETTEDLYNMMLLNKKLGGQYKLVDNEIIVWTFDDVIYEISMDGREGYFNVLKNNKFKLGITHWHPYEYEIYDDICKIGEKGNVLVIKTLLGGAQISYMGPKEKCTIKRKKIGLFKIHYFESK